MQVYIITNDVNDKAYIGACEVPLHRRWNNHKSRARKGRGHSLHAAMREIGIDKFHVVRLFSGYVSREAMKTLEQYYIKSFQTMVPNGYNETPGGTTRIFGGHGCLGYKHSEEAKIRIGKATAVRNAERGEIPEGFTFAGRSHSEESRRKISIGKTGSHKSDESRKRHSEAARLWWASRKSMGRC